MNRVCSNRNRRRANMLETRGLARSRTIAGVNLLLDPTPRLHSCALALLASASLAGATPPLLQDDPAPEATGEDEPEQRSGPPPFRQLADDERGLKLNRDGACQGYTLIAPLRSRTVRLIDMEGETVHTWEVESPPGGGVYLLDNGHLLYCGRVDDNPRFRGGGIGGRLEEYDWEGRLVWSYQLANEYQTQHHDMEVLPNGNILFICWEYLAPEDALAAGRDPHALHGEGLWTGAVLEVRKTGSEGGEIVWEWHSWDHLVQDRDPDLDWYGLIAEHPGRIDINADHRDDPPLTRERLEELRRIELEMRALGYMGEEEEEDEDEPHEAERDWLHTNAVDYHAGYDLIALSTPHMNEIWIIDHSTTTEEAADEDGGRWGQGGNILWRWGNPKNYSAGGVRDRRLFYQHDPRFIEGPGGALHLTLFNNGGGRPNKESYSSVEELALPFDPESGFQREAGKAFGPEEPVWIYSDGDNFFSSFISGAERLPNGNTLICSGAPGRVFEVTPEGEIVWEYWNPHGGDAPPSAVTPGAPRPALFRAARISIGAPALSRLGS